MSVRQSTPRRLRMRSMGSRERSREGDPKGEGMASIRLGFIGAGWWATSNHMPIFAARDDVEMAAVCRLGQEELRQVKDRFDFAFATEDYRVLLSQPLDAVVVSSPHTRHYEHAKAALERG